VTGFTLVFVAFWASIGAIGYALADNAKYLRQLGGAILIVFGLQVAGVINLRALWRDTRPMPAFGGAMAGGGMSGAGDTITNRAMASGAVAGGGTMTLGGGLGQGTSLHAPATADRSSSASCSPRLEPVHRTHPRRDHRTRLDDRERGPGHRPPPRYAAGLAVPSWPWRWAATWVARRLGWVGRHHRAVSLVSGAMLIGLGVLMVTNLLARLAALTAPLGG